MHLDGPFSCCDRKWRSGVEKAPTERVLTISGHADGQAFLEAAVLAPVAVHTHDETIFILHAHLVVNVLLNTAAKESLSEKSRRKTLRRV